MYSVHHLLQQHNVELSGS